MVRVMRKAVQDSRTHRADRFAHIRARSNPSSPFAPPPYYHPTRKKNQRHHDEEAPRYYRQRWFLQGQAAVDGCSVLNSDEVFIASKPVDKVDAKVKIPAVAEVSIGKKIAASDNGDPLLLFIYRAAHHSPDTDRTRYIVHCIERDAIIQIACFHPTVLSGLYQREAMPRIVFVDRDLACKRK